MKILFTGGGTGGHIFPIIAITREIKKISPQKIEFLYVGPKDEWALPLLPPEGIKVRTILAGKIRRNLGPREILLNIIDSFKLILGIFQAFFWVFIENPDLVFSKGGYGSIPVALNADILQVPLFLHESDIVPGLANKILGKLALEIFVSFPMTEYFDPKKIMLVGNPIREEILEGSKEEAKELFKLSKEKPVLLILGGSQGAQRINDLILLVLSELLEDFEVLHQTGSKNFKQVKAEAKVVIGENLEKYYHPLPFFLEPDLKQALAIADLVISRAGSGGIFEIAACGKPSILIPLPEAAQNHQVKNAYAYSKNGAAMVIEEANLAPHFFLERVKFLFSRPDILKEMSQKAKEFARPRAAAIIANYLLEYLTLEISHSQIGIDGIRKNRHNKANESGN